MGSITTNQIFRGEITIAQATVSPVNENVVWFITEYEPIFLRELFGEAFYTLFIAGINPPITDPITPVDARWTAILNLPGFKMAIARYIYYWYMRDQAEQTVGTGTGKPKNTNLINVSARDKVSKSWYKMYRVNWQVLSFLECNPDIYPEFTLPQWYYPFSVIWGNAQWNWSLDIFYSEVWYMYYVRYNIPEIFIPLSRL